MSRHRNHQWHNDSGLTGGGGDKEVEHQVHKEHEHGGQRLGQQHQRHGDVINNGVDDLTVSDDDGDRAGKADRGIPRRPSSSRRNKSSWQYRWRRSSCRQPAAAQVMSIIAAI